MQKKKVFISSVQSEFKVERQLLFEYLTSDTLLGKFLNANSTTVFLNEIENSDIYLGIFGQSYGFEDAKGISPTEREFDAATSQNKARFVYVKQAEQRDLKEKQLIQKAENVIVRKGFTTPEQLKTAVYASLVNYL